MEKPNFPSVKSSPLGGYSLGANWALAGTLALCAAPWLLSGARVPIAIGVVAAACALLLGLRFRVGQWLLVALAVTMLGLLALDWVTSGSDLAELQIGGVPLAGSMYILPIAAPIAAVVHRVLSNRNHL